MRKFGPARQLTALNVDWSSIYIQDAQDVSASVWKPRSRWRGLISESQVPADIGAMAAERPVYYYSNRLNQRDRPDLSEYGR
jgi:hypothetical protein